MPMPTPPVGGTASGYAGEVDVAERSVGELVGQVAEDMSRLMRQELALAKAETKVEAKRAVTGSAMMALAGIAGFLVLLFLSFALADALAEVMDATWAYLIVAVLWGIVAAVGAVLGRKKFQQMNPVPERTVETVKEIPDALTGHSAAETSRTGTSTTVSHTTKG